jgi:PiT family inorganic phosphate transporter
MMVLTAVLVLGVVWLAWSNGANDNFKGVATLLGSGTTSHRWALYYATGATLAGSMMALWLGERLVRTFSGKGLVPDAMVGDPAFLAAVACGAAATVLLATWFGLPISTTHALTGALVGAGLASPGGGIRLTALGSGFLVPLLVSPFIALAFAYFIYPLLRSARQRLGVKRETCVCVGREVRVVGVETSCAALAGAAEISVGSEAQCIQRYTGRVVGLSAQYLLDRLHFLTAGAVCFARGLNDTPKIAALLLGVGALGLGSGTVLVGIAMAVGGLVQSRRVAETMSHKITEMNHGQGFTANLVTAGLVIFASKLGVPVSTTHVSCGALFGIGAVTGGAKWRNILGIFLAWVTTLPLAAAFAALASLII